MKLRIKKFFVLFVVLCLSNMVAFAQQKQVTGTVTDEEGLPLPGVNVIVKGTSSGTNTDFDGNYSIEVDQGQVLEFSFIGFQNIEQTVGQEDVINITLKEDSQALDEVVVTAFGRTMTRNESTSSVSTISSEDIEKTTFSTPQQGLQGLAPGLKVTSSSGVPGSSPEVRIRGLNSITAGNSPLYVIDGLPVNSGDIGSSSDLTGIDLMSLLNPQDIESISVLKDASAVAPYGAEGANGVILITTKSGTRGAAKYNFSYRLGISNPAVRGLKSINAQQQYDALQRAYWNGFGDGGEMPSDIDDFILNVVGDDYIDHWKRSGKPDSDWYNLTRNKDAITHNLNFSMSSGDEKNSMYASVGYNDQEGTVIGTGFKRISGSVNYGTQISDAIHVQVSGNVANAKQNGLLEEGRFFGNPNYTRLVLPSMIHAYNEDGTLNIDDFTPYSSSYYNPIYIAKHDEIENNVTRAVQNTSLTWDITDNLTFSSRLGLDYTIRQWNYYHNPNHGDGLNQNGTKREVNTRYFNYTSQNSLDYVFTLGEKNHFNLTAVQEFTRHKISELSGYGENFPSEVLKNLDATSSNFETGSNFQDRMNMRWVGLMNYDFDKRYLVNATFSYQGDSRFSDRWGSFYSLGLGWNLHQESFLANAGAVDVLRLKLGYGETGNADIGINKFQPLLGFETYNASPAGVLVGYGTDATWERSRRMDVALDFEFFNNRLGGTLGYFYNTTRDMLLEVPLPFTTTFYNATVLRNQGEMRNSGIEFDINGDLIKTPDFTWNLGFNIGTLNNKVTDLSDEAEIIASDHVIQRGHKAFEWYMPEFAGIDPDNGDPLWYVDRTQSDETTNQFSQAERQYTGKSRIPTYTGAFSTRIDFKNFYLKGMVFFSGGNKIYDPESRYTQSTGGDFLHRNTSIYAYNGAWEKPGDDAEFPRFDGNDNSINNFFSQAHTGWLYDGGYMRLRNIELGYTFRDDVLGKLPLNAVTLSIQGTNLWTWVKDKRLHKDPEVRDNGYFSQAVKPVKTVTFNVNINF